MSTSNSEGVVLSLPRAEPCPQLSLITTCEKRRRAPLQAVLGRGSSRPLYLPTVCSVLQCSPMRSQKHPPPGESFLPFPRSSWVLSIGAVAQHRRRFLFSHLLPPLAVLATSLPGVSSCGASPQHSSATSSRTLHCFSSPLRRPGALYPFLPTP